MVEVQARCGGRALGEGRRYLHRPTAASTGPRETGLVLPKNLDRLAEELPLYGTENGKEGPWGFTRGAVLRRCREREPGLPGFQPQCRAGPAGPLFGKLLHLSRSNVRTPVVHVCEVAADTEKTHKIKNANYLLPAAEEALNLY